jgi:hypothetical protein
MKFNVYEFKVPDRQWIVWIKNDPLIHTLLTLNFIR